jgi:type IV secretory pathway VirB10-like protein
MESKTRIFFAGVGTTFFILGIGFGGGLMMAKSTLEPTTPVRAADRLPPARIILPASAEAAAPPQPPVQTVALSEPSPQVMPAKEAQQASERDNKAERTERHNAKAEERARRKKYAERKARREAARMATQHQARQPVGILAFGGDDNGSSGSGNFFGN